MAVLHYRGRKKAVLPAYVKQHAYSVQDITVKPLTSVPGACTSVVRLAGSRQVIQAWRNQDECWEYFCRRTFAGLPIDWFGVEIIIDPKDRHIAP